MKTRQPYVRRHSNRFGESRIVIWCACGAGFNGDPDRPASEWPPHAENCALYTPPAPAVDENVKESK